jgi:uncharacterized protein (TIGR02117 family)
MHKITICILITLLFCINQESNSQKRKAGQITTHHVYVVQQAWHTGLIMQTELPNPDIWPEASNYTNKQFVDISWGDEKFYQARGRPILMAARAILWPTQSVLRIYPFSLSIQSSYGTQARIIKIPVSDKHLKALTAFLAKSYMRDDAGNPQPSTEHGESDIFFLGTRKYHLFSTCNTWMALAFKETGFDIRSTCVLNANQLFRQLEKIEGATYYNR